MLHVDGCPPERQPHLREIRLGNGVELRDGRVLTDVKLVAGRLRSAAAPQADFAGARLFGNATSGMVRVSLDAVAAPGPADVPLYTASFEWGDMNKQMNWHGQGGFAPICPVGERAFLVPGTWDYESGKQVGFSDTVITLACEKDAMGKCALRMGYRPWESRNTARGGTSVPVPLRDYFQACLRAVRADYCGSGQSLTRLGMTLNIYDDLGIQKDEKDWPLEARWTPEGARCVGATRLTHSPLKEGETVRAYLSRTCPERLKPESGACPADKDVLIFTEAPPASP